MTEDYEADAQHSIERTYIFETKSIETSANVTASGNTLLNALWRSPDQCHLIGALNNQTHCFKNFPVNGVDDAIERAKTLSGAATETYFACAEYLTPNSRVASNASGAYSFWIDLDCGDSKAAKGVGYATCDDAVLALESFCRSAALPQPTHRVASGGGLHVYWILDSRICRETWQAYARQLKALTKALGFLADHCRTADIASVLRLPGTLNYKYTPPSPVVLIHAAADFIGRSVMLDAITAAHDRLCNVAATPRSTCLVTARPPRYIDHANDESGCPHELVKLTSALAVLDPDCDEPTWTLHRLAPMAREARDHPEFHDQLYALARSWSSGELGGIESQACATPGSNGRTGEEYFDTVWNRFLNEKYSGRLTTLRSIYRDAVMTGWVAPAHQFEVIDNAVEVAA